MSLDPSLTSALAVTGVVLGALGLVLALLAHLRLRRLRRAYSVLQAGDGDVSFVEAAVRTSRVVDALRADVEVVHAGLEEVRTDLADAIRHVAVVRYDAFGDMGGRLSFSAAMLDDAGDGLVLTSINGRSETRTYAKGVKHGTSEAQLSPEEEQVVGWALRGRAAPPGRQGTARVRGRTPAPAAPPPPAGQAAPGGRAERPAGGEDQREDRREDRREDQRDGQREGEDS